MHVLQLNKAYYPHIGGMETVVQLLSEGLHSKPGVDVEVLVCNDRTKTVKKLVGGLQVKYAGSYGTLFSCHLSPSFPFLLARTGADIVHAHMPFPLGEISLVTLAALGRQPYQHLMVWWHGDTTRHQWLLPAYRTLVARVLDTADRIFVATPHHISSSTFLRRYASKCVVVPYGLPLSTYRSTPTVEGRVKRNLQKYGSQMILFVGRLVYYKGIQYLIEAMSQTDRGTLVLVGEGPLEAKLRDQVKHLDIEERVVFLPTVSHDELVALYHSCELFVLPSTRVSEGFGIVQVEAMACGKPVVTTDLPTGVTYVNQAGKTGLVVPRRSPGRLAEAIQCLLTDRETRMHLGAYAKSRVEREFSQEIMTERVLKVYREVLDKAGG